jgi:beta propeller repeat protein
VPRTALLAVLVSLTMCALAPSAWAVAPQTRVNSNPRVPTSQNDPSVSGNTIVWVDYRGSSPNIYAKNMSTGVETTVCAAPGDQDQPAISGNRVVWRDKRNGNYDIYMKDLVSGVESVVCTATGDQEEPDIDGDRVVWTDHRDYSVGTSANWHYEDIYMRNVATGQESVVSDEHTGETMPAISGDIVTWVRWSAYYVGTVRKHNCRIQWKDLATGQKAGFGAGYQRDHDISGNILAYLETIFDADDNPIGTRGVAYNVSTAEACVISSSQRDKEDPRISGGRVVWREWDSSARTYHILTTTAFTGTPAATVVSRTTWAGAAAVSGDRVVWADSRAATYDTDVYTKLLPTGVETLVTTNDMVPSWQGYPVVDGDRVVWMDDRTRDDSTDQMYTKNLATGVEEAVRDDAIAVLPDLSGDVLVWWSFEGQTEQIKMKNLATGVTSDVCANPARQGWPAISGNVIVWADSRNSTDTDGYNIYMKNLATGVESAVTTHAGEQSQPDVSGNVVVWQDWRRGEADIWARVLGQAERPVTEATGTQQDPVVSGTIVVWEDFRTDPAGDIWMRDLSGGTETAVATGTGAQLDPAISGEILVWTDKRGAYPTLRLRNIRAREERVLVNDPRAKPCNPRVSGGRIVWEDYREGTDTIPDANIYTTTIDVTAPHTTISTLPTGWVRGPVRFSLTASDAGSPAGITTRYKLTPPGTAYTSRIGTVTAEGTTTIFYWSTDVFGNREATHTAIVRIDRTPPVTGSDVKASYVASATVRLTPVDTRSGVASTRWVLGSAAGTGTSVRTTVAGGHTLRWSSADRAGNREATRTATFAVVPAAPVGLAASPLSASAISLRWGRAAAGTGVTAYTVERSTSPTGTFSRLATVTVPYWANGGLPANTAYYYRVRAFGGGVRSAPSAVVSARTLAAGTVAIREDASPLVYAGTRWITRTSASFLGGAARSTTRTADRVTVPFRGSAVSWIGTKGPGFGKATVALDGVVVATVDLYATTTAYGRTLFTRAGLADRAHTLTITLAGKNASSTGYRMDVDGINVTGVAAGLNAEEPAGVYAGRWTARASSYLSGGTARESGSSTASVTCTFRGTGVTWIGTRSPARGMARVYLDGVPQGTVDQFGAATAYQAVVWRKSGLPNGTHVLRIVPAGTRNAVSSANTVDVDAFGVR